MDKLFAEFMMEKEYVCGLSKTTLKGYWVTWRTFKRFIKEPTVSRDKKLKAEKKIHPAYTDDELIKMVRWKPKTWP